MTIENRKDREKLRMKELILQTAAQIITEEGIEKLSIRKIAGRIEYSPGIIYHYFSNKNEIISQLMRQGYQTLMSALSENQPIFDSPANMLKTLTRRYIDAALCDPDRFLAIQLNRAPEIQEFTAYLFPGAAEQKPALQVLAQAVRDTSANSRATDQEIEMTAQIIAASTLGFIAKLVLEKDIGDDRREQLIERFTDSVVRMAGLNSGVTRTDAGTDSRPGNNIMKRKGTI